jgi:excisionase family DNA binding protein
MLRTELMAHQLTEPEIHRDRNGTRTTSVRRLLTLPQAVEYIGLSAWKLRQLIHEGRLPIVELNEGQKFWIDRRDLDSLVERAKRTL